MIKFLPNCGIEDLNNIVNFFYRSDLDNHLGERGSRGLDLNEEVFDFITRNSSTFGVALLSMFPDLYLNHLPGDTAITVAIDASDDFDDYLFIDLDHCYAFDEPDTLEDDPNSVIDNCVDSDYIAVNLPSLLASEYFKGILWDIVDDSSTLKEEIDSLTKQLKTANDMLKAMHSDNGKKEDSVPEKVLTQTTSSDYDPLSMFDRI